ncbi:MAG TPA: hypothetical protein VHE08_07105 [Solirubrobacterales bacterium]|nr:hypothetical protein [Solirubrobacterales bacterium]
MAARASKTVEADAEGIARRAFGNPGALASARRHPMSERLELALSWNAVAAELRSGLAGATRRPAGR